MFCIFCSLFWSSPTLRKILTFMNLTFAKNYKKSKLYIIFFFFFYAFDTIIQLFFPIVYIWIIILTLISRGSLSGMPPLYAEYGIIIIIFSLLIFTLLTTYLKLYIFCFIVSTLSIINNVLLYLTKKTLRDSEILDAFSLAHMFMNRFW